MQYLSFRGYFSWYRTREVIEELDLMALEGEAECKRQRPRMDEKMQWRVP